MIASKDGRAKRKPKRKQTTAGDKPTFNQPKLLYRATEVAHLCSVDVSTVWRWARRIKKPLRAVRIGARCTRFRADDLQRFIAEAMHG